MRKPEDTATIERELSAVDHALEAGAVGAADPVERELQELALALRADSPQPDRAFAASLGKRVEGGFPRERRAPLHGRLSRRRLAGPSRPARRPSPRSAGSSLRSRLPRIGMLPAAGAVASVLIALVVVVSIGDGDDGGQGAVAPQSPSADLPSSKLPAPLAAEGRSGSADSMIAPEPVPPPGGDGFDPGARERRIEHSARLTLAAPGDELDKVSDGIAAVTERYDGFVLNSSLTSGDGGLTGGSFELRIPADKLRPALRELAELGSVRSQTQSGQDVTRVYTTSADRLQAVRSERRGLLRRLERADSDRQAEAIRRRLDLVTGEIRSLRAQLRELRLRTDYAAVSVVVEQSDSDSGENGGIGGTDEALDDALGSLADSLNIALRVLGVVLPLTLVGLLGWLAVRAIARRRRESALA